MTWAATFGVYEYGNLCGTAVDGDPESEMRAIQRCLTNFDATRAKAFPDWNGPCEIIRSPFNPWLGTVRYGWYAQVPIEDTTPGSIG